MSGTVREEVVFKRTPSVPETVTHYCPGCTHGIIHRLVAEAIDELGVAGRTIGVAPVGCAVFAYNYFNLDFAEAPHGRATAMATGIKRVSPDKVVFTYQGDGDLAAIGTGETVHVATRGENITVVFINNAVYGMTGGQMAPTTLPGMVSTSTQSGRDVEVAGYPIRLSEMLATTSGAAYVVRRSVHDIANIRKTKKALLTAFKVQMQGMGFSMVEILSTCPTNWGLPAAKALQFIEEKMVPYYPLGDYKVMDAVRPLVVS